MKLTNKQYDLAKKNFNRWGARNYGFYRNSRWFIWIRDRNYCWNDHGCCNSSWCVLEYC